MWRARCWPDESCDATECGESQSGQSERGQAAGLLLPRLQAGLSLPGSARRGSVNMTGGTNGQITLPTDLGMTWRRSDVTLHRNNKIPRSKNRLFER